MVFGHTAKEKKTASPEKSSPGFFVVPAVTLEELNAIQQTLLAESGKQPGDPNRRSGYCDGVFDVFNEAKKIIDAKKKEIEEKENKG